MTKLGCILFCLSLLLPFAAQAQEAPRLRFPLDCDLGENCWLMNLPDTDPSPDKARDYLCGPRSYNEHSGTDFAIQDKAAMEKGVPVLAAADGKVKALRDGEEDDFRDTQEMDEIKKIKKECGNGVIIDHGNNWVTQYCHLKKGSIAVEKDQEVKAGHEIAAVGLSGITEHPHLHITLRQKDRTIDPFTGKSITEGCGLEGDSLWVDRIPYQDYALYDGGFADNTPDFAQISQGIKPKNPVRESSAGIFWFAYFGARQGDQISLKITSPSGNVLAEHQVTQDKDRARQYYFTGRKMLQGWPEKGTYKGEARVARVGPDAETHTEVLVRELTLD